VAKGCNLAIDLRFDKGYVLCVAGTHGTQKDKDMSNTIKTLRSLPAPTLFLLNKLVGDECKRQEKVGDKKVKVRREELGQHKAEFEVDETIEFSLQGTVKVGESSPDAVKANVAKPWNLVAITLGEANKYAIALLEANKALEALGAVGIDVAKAAEAAKAAGHTSTLSLETIVAAAEDVDEATAKEIEAETKAVLKLLKAETKGFKFGSVRPTNCVAVITSRTAGGVFAKADACEAAE
jgi:hypothetical protein